MALSSTAALTRYVFAGSPSPWSSAHFLAGCQAGLHTKCAHFSITLRGKLSYPCFEPESHSLSTTEAPATLSNTRLCQTSWREQLPSLMPGGVDRAGLVGTWTVLLAWGGAASSELQGIAHRGDPGSLRGLSSLSGGRQVQASGCLPEGHRADGGFLSPPAAGNVWPVSNSPGSAGRKPAPAHTTGKERLSPHPDLGSWGPLFVYFL